MIRRILLSACLGCLVDAQAMSFTNDIALPPHLYMLSDTRNELFFKPFVKRWRPFDDFVRVGQSAAEGRPLRHLSHVVTFDKPVDGARLSIRLVNSDAFETVKEVNPVLRVGTRGVGKTAVSAQIVGDSFTHGGFFRWALHDTDDVPGLSLVGLRTCLPGKCIEGRGGWTLASYFAVPRGEQYSYHGFMHPVGGRYWGDRAFWKMAWRCVRKTQPKGFQPAYACAGFDRCVTRFDESTGTLLAPADGDVQYDPVRKSMVRFDGSDWVPVEETSLDWAFDYGKYLAMWQIEKPRFLFELLGLNDFGEAPIDVDFTEWGRRIRLFKESYLKACPEGRFVICTPCSSCGSDDNAAGMFLTLENAKMWRFRDWLIKSFGGREKEGYYLLDTAIATDNDRGFDVLDERSSPVVTLPYDNYQGNERLRVQQGNPHPYPNYPAMSVPIAAFIQYWRDR